MRIRPRWIASPWSSSAAPRGAHLATVLLALAFAGGLAAVPLPASAGTPVQLHVDVDSVGGACSDGHTLDQAGSPKTPLCTLARALVVAPGGSVVLLRRGALPKTIVRRGASRSDHVTVRPFPGEADQVSIAGLQLIDAGFVRFEEVRFTAGAQIGPRTHDVDVVGGRFDNASLVIKPGSTRVSVSENKFTVPQGYGVVLSDETKIDKGEIVDVRIEHNHFAAIGADAIQAKNFDRLLHRLQRDREHQAPQAGRPLGRDPNGLRQ